MNVLRVIGSMNPSSGGPCQGIRNTIPELAKRGVNNEVVCFDEPGASFLKKDPFIIHALGPGKSPWNYSARLIPWLLDNFHRFDAVVVHGLWLYHSYGVKKALAQYKEQKKGQLGEKQKLPKFFIMPHGMLDPYFQRAADRRLKAIRNWAYWKIIESNVVNEADGLLFTCEAELQLAREPFKPYLPKQEINVGYGITEPPAYNDAMQEAWLDKCPGVYNKPYLLFLSRIHEKKGVDLLVKAYAAVLSAKEKGHGELPKLVIAGPGLETPYGEHIQELVANTEELKEMVFFPGMLTHETKWGAFYGCEAFVLPSHQENFGIAVVEALACGKPVLISDQVNIWREILQEEGGWVAKDTQAGTAALLAKWLDLPAGQKQAMAKNARRTYEHFFAIGSNIDKFHAALMAN